MCDTCVQANVMCTTTRAKKVIVSLILVTVTLTALIIVNNFAGNYMYKIIVSSIWYAIIYGILPAAILIINLIVVREVRRLSHYAATNPGLQPHH